MITKEDLLKRKEALLGDYNAIGGALQDVNFWLNFLEKEDLAGEVAPITTQEMK